MQAVSTHAHRHLLVQIILAIVITGASTFLLQLWGAFHLQNLVTNFNGEL